MRSVAVCGQLALVVPEMRRHGRAEQKGRDGGVQEAIVEDLVEVEGAGLDHRLVDRLVAQPRIAGRRGVGLFDELDGAGEGVVQLRIEGLDAEGERQVVAAPRERIDKKLVEEPPGPAEDADEGGRPEQSRQMDVPVDEADEDAGPEGEGDDGAQTAGDGDVAVAPTDHRQSCEQRIHAGPPKPSLA